MVTPVPKPAMAGASVASPNGFASAVLVPPVIPAAALAAASCVTKELPMGVVRTFWLLPLSVMAVTFVVSDAV
jgi:hypothetical protein